MNMKSSNLHILKQRCWSKSPRLASKPAYYFNGERGLWHGSSL